MGINNIIDLAASSSSNGTDALGAVLAGFGIFVIVLYALWIAGIVFSYWIIAYQLNLAQLQGNFIGAGRVFLTGFVVNLVSMVTCGIAPVIYALVNRQKMTQAKLQVQSILRQNLPNNFSGQQPQFGQQQFPQAQQTPQNPYQGQGQAPSF
ncbi:hypothetical protein FACS1894125_0970 [Actinomycetota bacterium]|nr:hypothetical protein FACS1894125_0970 [Actinomycetota bacterium]